MNWLYYLIQLTWGLPLNIIGAIIYLILKYSFNCSVNRFRNMFCIIVPSNFGGMNLGMFTVLGCQMGHLISHEYGHSIQNLMFGWFTPFMISIPSAIRYWYRNILTAIGKPLQTTYNDIWFEAQATELGRLAAKSVWSWL